MGTLGSGLTTLEQGAVLWRPALNANFILLDKLGGFGADGLKLLDDTDSPYTATFVNRWMLGDTTSGNIIIDLPTAASGNAGREFTIKKNAAANLLSIDPNGAELINGATTFILRRLHEAVTIVSDGTNWVIIDAVGIAPADSRMIGASLYDLVNGLVATFTSVLLTLPADLRLNGNDVQSSAGLVALTLNGNDIEVQGKALVRNNDADGTTLDLRHDDNGANTIQNRVQMARVPTTNATVTTLWTLTIASGEMVVVEAMVAGNSSGGGNHAGVSMWGVFFNNAGTVSQVGASQGTVQATGPYAIAFDVTGATVRVRVTGEAATNVEWQGAMRVLGDVPIG